ncbi:hypothetical protein MHYP_G00230160 [Metynnis hypsauchen]
MQVYDLKQLLDDILPQISSNELWDSFLSTGKSSLHGASELQLVGLLEPGAVARLAVVGRVPGTVIWWTNRNKNHIARDFHPCTALQVLGACTTCTWPTLPA